jgi:hypothetical protein
MLHGGCVMAFVAIKLEVKERDAEKSQGQLVSYTPSIQRVAVCTHVAVHMFVFCRQ